MKGSDLKRRDAETRRAQRESDATDSKRLLRSGIDWIISTEDKIKKLGVSARYWRRQAKKHYGTEGGQMTFPTRSTKCTRRAEAIESEILSLRIQKKKFEQGLARIFSASSASPRLNKNEEGAR